MRCLLSSADYPHSLTLITLSGFNELGVLFSHPSLSDHYETRLMGQVISHAQDKNKSKLNQTLDWCTVKKRSMYYMHVN